MSETQNMGVGATGETKAWGETLQLPKTDFAMRANLPTREPAWVQRWLEQDVYGKLRAKRVAEGAPKFIVHLGPPYANGNMHMGHALTYVLKDFIVRHKFMMGFDSPYAPGWDCHGLPIEWKVEQDELRAKGKTKHDVSREQLRTWCRAYASKWVGVQKAEWQRFGAIGDWDNPYLTMAPANEAGIVTELGKMVRRGLVYRGLRSTQWSWAEETALAEAEVEYKDVTSTAVYVALPLVGKDDEFLVIWTTTPWTLPANRAVAVKVDEDYVAVELVPAMGIVKDGEAAKESGLPFGSIFWVAKGLKDAFLEKVGFGGVVHETVAGEAMVGWEYQQPLYNTVQKVLPGFHVTTDAGTGLVHIAPAHGQEDFLIGKEFGLDLNCPVDGAGKYESNVPALPLTGEAIAGKLIWPMQKMILAELEQSGRLLAKNDFQHSYPVSWRSKEKLIFRSTEQWFVTMDEVMIPETGKSLRESSLDRIYGKGVKPVTWVPEYGANRIGSMIQNRPDWCISRQRVWGVPITIMQNKTSGELIADEAVWDHIARLVAVEGIDAWDNRLGGREAELFPDGWLASKGAKPSDFAYSRDILDVWFDSGTTHAHVLRADAKTPDQRFYRADGKRPADVYLEGSDQHRGWFHSSLLTSVANYGDAPYETVVTHGYVVDGDGRKFSKSLGNGVEPRQLMEKYGMDIIRLWVASADYSEDIRYSPQILEAIPDAYRRFRNTFRWLLGNMNGVTDIAVDEATLPELERYMMHRLHTVMAEVHGHYEAFQFHKGYRALYEFCGTELSNFYFDVRKDVLYCDAVDSPVRQACVSVLVQIFRSLATYLAPLMPFTADEAWRERYGEGACVFMEKYHAVEDVEVNLSRWDLLFWIRNQVNQKAEELRSKGELKANYEIVVHYNLSSEGLLGAEDKDLVALVCGASEAEQIKFDEMETYVQIKKHDGHKCPRCWRYYGKLEQSGVCFRCDEAVTTMKAA